jgi:hypothetical protein
MSIHPYWIALLVTPLLVRWLGLHAQTAGAKRKGDIAFFPASGLAFVCFISVAMGTAIAVGGWRQGAGMLTLVIGIGWVLFSLWLWPSTIALDAHGLTAKHIWRPTRTIAYADIACVSRMADGSAIVYGNGRVKQIWISEYHVGDAELADELKKRGITYYGGSSPAAAK